MASEDGNSTSPPDPMIQSTLSLGSVEVGHMISCYSSASASWPFNPSAGEDFVNVAALRFLSSLTIKLGAATLHAITDGRLCSRGNNDIYSIVKVKPYLFQSSPDITLMQMGIEMLTWIADCEQGTGSPKKRLGLLQEAMIL
ncbi:uncharacterized protein TRUGW13939_03795 [Talaromyces rugulosus]|uniref:Uncharacterized protein n=1 Tax=Talaromyces rugulosus TaxID=121627 RepID=A0A7H8QS16_TALRU|nr:uncharacterized protein TRUGW13939_03795 [Talaromyces rugulosus]QKX56689.1 hypothetical protein TRUGW13939_03795 [Talaromyces rugulosus]